MLPVVDSRVIHEFKLPYSKQIVKIKPYKSAQEKILLHSILDKKEKKTWFNNILQILKENKVEGNIEFDENMSTIDFLYTCIKLRCLSKGEIFNYSFKCEGFVKDEEGNDRECQHVFRESDSLDQLILVKNSDTTKVICEINPTLSIELQAPSIKYYDYLATIDEDVETEIERMDDEGYLEKRNLDVFCNQVSYSVSKVIMMENGKPKVYTDFTPEEFRENILMNLPITDLNKIYESKQKLIKLSIRIRKVCPVCKTAFEKEEKNFFEYVA